MLGDCLIEVKIPDALFGRPKKDIPMGQPRRINACWGVHRKAGDARAIPGVLLIVGSFGYSLRKRQLITFGKPVTLLRLHEYMAWAGSLLILVHAGIHFNAILGWLAVWAMLVNIASGLTGKFLLQRARIRLEETRTQMRATGLTGAELEDKLYWDSLTFDAVRQWRSGHYPITLAFAVLALGHIVSIFLFWGWR